MYVPAEHKRAPVFFAPSATGGGAANTTRSGMISSGMNNGVVPPSNNDGMVFSIAAANICTSPERETTTTASKRGRDGSPARYHGEPTLSPHPGAIPLHYQQQGQLQQVSAVMPIAVSMAETTTAALPPNAAPPKRTRTNEYRPPRKVPTSFTSQVGSLAVGHHVMMMGNNNNNNHASSTRTTREQQQQQQMASRAVGLRRQLSSSKIEAFLSSSDDAMDVDVEQGRPRSMSL
jgi:hypothetical protein